LEPEELKDRYKGIQIVMITPFNDDFSLDEEGLRENTRFLIEKGVHVLHPTGSTGEFWNLTVEEHMRVIETVVDEAEGRVPVIPGTGYSGTKQTIEVSKYAEEVGADGVLVVPPYYVTPTPEGIYEHYRALAESIKIGIIIYNNPGMTKIALGSDLLAKLAEIPNIVGVKDTTANFLEVVEHLYLLGDKLRFSVGLEPQAPYFYLAGGEGCVSELANFAPQIPLKMYKAAMEKNWKEMMELHHKLEPYYEFVDRKSRENKGMIWITIIKEAMKLLELPGWPPRKPLLPLKEEDREELRRILRKIGLRI